MLAPDSRTLLMDQLAPPPGATFDTAVATTFTLDLTATLLPTLAFTGFHLASGTSDPIATLESIRSTADRIDVFCQAGAIAVPEQAPDLLAFLEPMVHPVQPPGAGLFHPKVWFVRYDHGGTASYRLLVLTRNLTMDSSWDLAVRLDSEQVLDGPQERSAALGSFLRSLAARSALPLAAERTARIAALADEADRVVWERPDNVEDVWLHYLNPDRPTSMDMRGSRHLVVSPFVDAGGLNRVRDTDGLAILSRADELEKLDPGTLARLEARVLDDLAVVQQVEGTRLGGSLHAKMYVVEQTTNWSKSHVFIGSANATWAAFEANTEFMLELRGHKKYLGIDSFLGTEGAFTSLTQPYNPSGNEAPDVEDLAQRELDNAVRRVAGLAFTAEVLLAQGALGSGHTMRLKSSGPFPLDPGWFATVELLTLPDFASPVPAGQVLDTVVPDVETADITPFLAIRVESTEGRRGSAVVLAHLVNAPEDRLDVVLARQLDTPEKFLKFLFFLLSLGDPRALAAIASGSSGTRRGGNPFGVGGSGILEMVLGALDTKPASLLDLDAVVSRLASTEDGRKSLPEGFLEFWAVVRDAADLSERGAP